MSSFNDFPLQSATQAVLNTMGITEPTPIQAEAIPALLAGKDLVGQSATGSGKTLAYSLPLVERLARNQRLAQALVMVPTRELAMQVNSVLVKFASSRRLTTALLVGGRPYSGQISALRYGAQIIVGTPGRIKDHLERGSLVLSHLRICVLDEADQMLDSGFAPVIEEILTTTPETRQMALFSATMPDWVEKLQQKFLKDPVKISITPAAGEASTIEQIAYQVPQEKKMAALCTLLQSTEGESSLIFGRTKFGVEKLGKQLTRLGFTVGTLHGNKSQNAREAVLTAFRSGQVQTLLATNVAARGLDIKGIYQVINYELPESSELFTHRIGRTGRMGQQGKAITLLAPSDVPKWRRMARSLGQAVPLQRLTINEAAMLPPTQELNALPENVQEPEVLEVLQEEVEQQVVRSRKPVSADQERSRPARARRDEVAPRRQRREDRWEERREGRGEVRRDARQERIESEASTEFSEQPAAFPQRSRTPYADRMREGRRGERVERGTRGAGRPSDTGRRGSDRRKERVILSTESRHQRATRRDSNKVTPISRGRRATAINRASR